MCLSYAGGSSIEMCIHTYIHTCMHACMHTYIHTYIHTYMHLHMVAPQTYVSNKNVGIYGACFCQCFMRYARVSRAARELPSTRHCFLAALKETMLVCWYISVGTCSGVCGARHVTCFFKGVPLARPNQNVYSSVSKVSCLSDPSCHDAAKNKQF